MLERKKQVNMKEKNKENKFKKPQYNMNDIVVNENSELFFSFSISRGFPHAFIFVGIHDKETNENYILYSIGKNLLDPPKTKKKKLSFLKSFIFSKSKDSLAKTKSSIQEETWMYRVRENVKKPIFYKAFSISEENYTQFLDVVNHCKIKDTDSENAFLKIKNENGKITYRCGKISKTYSNTVKVKSDLVDQKAGEIRYGNSCRETAMDLFDSIFDKSYRERNTDIRSSFLSVPPFRANVLSGGKIEEGLFIFPAPPNPNDKTINVKRYLALSRMYQQLERIPRKHINNKHTMEKFNKLKALYVSLNSQESMDIKTLFQTINKWEKKNKKLIDQKRSFLLFGKTATRRMVEDLKHIQEWPGYPDIHLKVSRRRKR